MYPASKNTTIFRLALYCIMVCQFSAYILTLRDGHTWGGDFSQYIAHAKNIALGVNYGDTPYLYNPDYSTHGPRTYPPIFPLLLAPMYALFGLDFYAFKVAVNAFVPASLLLLYFVLKEYYSERLALIAVFISAANPVFWSYRDEILPEAPFTCFTLAALLLIQQAYKKEWDKSHPVLTGAVLGVAIYIAYGCRSVGLALLPAFLIFEVLQQRKVTLFAIVTTLAFACLAGCASMLVYSDRSYLEQLTLSSLTVYYHNVVEYLRAVSSIWDNGYFRIAQYILAATFSILAIVGYARSVRRSPTAGELFVFFYILILIAWPGGNGVRYLYPIVPLYIWYVVVGMHQSVRGISVRFQRYAWIAFFALIALTFVGRYMKAETGPILEGIRNPSFISLCNTISSRTAPDQRFIFWNPRLLSLMTGRKAAVYSKSEDPRRVWGHIQRDCIDYIIFTKFVDKDATYLGPAIDNPEHPLEVIYQNSDYTMYKVNLPMRGSQGRCAVNQEP